MTIKVIIKYLYSFLPDFFANILLKWKREKDFNKALNRAKKFKVTKEELSTIIDSLEIDGDVFLHTSLMNIGKVVGGAKFVSELIMRKVDLANNTLIVSALPVRESFRKYIKTKPVFNVKTADIAMGAVNEYIANCNNAIRSLHPTHSVVAIGNNAIEYTDEHHLGDTPFSKESPYYKIIKHDGYVMLLGTNFDHITMIHAVEDIMGDNYPIKMYSDHMVEMDVVDYNDKKFQVKVKYHNKHYAITRDAQSIWNELNDSKIIKSIPIGDNFLSIIKAKDFAKEYIRIVRNGRTICGKQKIGKDVQANLDYIIKCL